MGMPFGPVPAHPHREEKILSALQTRTHPLRRTAPGTSLAERADLCTAASKCRSPMASDLPVDVAKQTTACAALGAPERGRAGTCPRSMRPPWCPDVFAIVRTRTALNVTVPPNRPCSGSSSAGEWGRKEPSHSLGNLTEISNSTV
jgi:hypothetical protein